MNWGDLKNSNLTWQDMSVFKWQELKNDIDKLDIISEKLNNPEIPDYIKVNLQAWLDILKEEVPDVETKFNISEFINNIKSEHPVFLKVVTFIFRNFLVYAFNNTISPYLYQKTIEIVQLLLECFKSTS